MLLYHPKLFIPNRWLSLAQAFQTTWSPTFKAFASTLHAFTWWLRASTLPFWASTLPFRAFRSATTFCAAWFQTFWEFWSLEFYPATFDPTTPFDSNFVARLGLLIQMEVLPDFSKAGCCSYVLHFLDELAKVADIIWVQLQVAVSTSLNPQGLIRVLGHFPQSITVKPIYNVIFRTLKMVNQITSYNKNEKAIAGTKKKEAELFIKLR